MTGSIGGMILAFAVGTIFGIALVLLGIRRHSRATQKKGLANGPRRWSNLWR